MTTNTSEAGLLNCLHNEFTTRNRRFSSQESQEARWIDLDAVDGCGNTALMLAVQSNRMGVVELVLNKAIHQNRFKQVLHQKNNRGEEATSMASQFLDHSQLAVCTKIFEEMAQLDKRRQMKRRRHSISAKISSKSILLRRSKTRAHSAHFSPQAMFSLNRRSNESTTKDKNGSRYQSVKEDAGREDDDENSAGASDVEPEFEDNSQSRSQCSKPAPNKKLQRGSSGFIVGNEDDLQNRDAVHPKTSLPNRLDEKEERILRPPPQQDMPSPQASLLLSLGDRLRNLMHTRQHSSKRDHRAITSNGQRQRQSITALGEDFSTVSTPSFFDEPATHTSVEEPRNLDFVLQSDKFSPSCPTPEHDRNSADKSKTKCGYSSMLADTLAGAGGRRWQPSTAKCSQKSSCKRTSSSHGREEEMADTDEFHSLMQQTAISDGRPKTCVPHSQHVQFDEDLNIYDAEADQEFKKRPSSSPFRIFRYRASSEGRHRHRENNKSFEHEE